MQLQATTYDPTRLLERVGGNRELFQEVLGVALADLQQALDELKLAIARQDMQSILLYSHRMKGTFGDIAADSARRAAAAVERGARDGSLPVVYAGMPLLESETATVAALIRDDLERTPSAAPTSH